MKKKLNKISRCGILMSEIEAHHKERLHVALKRSGFFTTVCTVSTFVILRKHKSAARSTNSNKRKTPWESQSFPLWNSQRRAGGCGLALRCVLTANDTTWKCITWHPGGSYSLGLYFIWPFPLFSSFSRQPWTTKFIDVSGGRQNFVLWLTPSKLSVDGG